MIWRFYRLLLILIFKAYRLLILILRIYRLLILIVRIYYFVTVNFKVSKIGKVIDFENLHFVVVVDFAELQSAAAQLAFFEKF